MPASLLSMARRKDLWLDQVHANADRLPSISMAVARELVGYAIGRLWRAIIPAGPART
jgi:hypothetical protein